MLFVSSFLLSLFLSLLCCRALYRPPPSAPLGVVASGFPFPPFLFALPLQDPSYPVYVDTSVMVGQTGEVNEETMQYDNIVYMPCKPDNDFFPDLKVGNLHKYARTKVVGLVSASVAAQSFVPVTCFAAACFLQRSRRVGDLHQGLASSPKAVSPSSVR